MAITEDQTRAEIIDKNLYKAGWDLADASQVTEEFDIFLKPKEEINSVREPVSKYHGHQFVDYLLFAKDRTPLCVVEAKRTSKDARLGQEQALQYAQKIEETQNVKRPFIYFTNGYDIYFWDSENYPPRKVYGFASRDDLEKLHFINEEKRPLSTEMIDTSIAGRPYQIEAIKTILEEIEDHKRKFLLVMATGTGKTRVSVALIDALMRSNRVQRVLFLVDRIELKIQALQAFNEFLPNSPSWPKEGEKTFSKDRRIYVNTYQSMLNMIQDESNGLTPFFFDLVVADESHRSIYNVYKEVLNYFDSYEVGLTATPTDRLEHDTFALFNCETGIPTYAYTYEQALENIPPYLCDFEVLKVRSKFQVEGIKGEKLPVPIQKKLIEEGRDVEDIDFEGSEIERKVTNSGTNKLIVREFMEESIKDSNGVIPGKSIIFAMSKAHARRLADIFNELYPEYKGELAKVIVSDDPRAYGKGGLIDQFKTQNFPRVALSVDMLDTGIDVKEVVNLVFAKPVYSFTKFWQMIGRGTRVLDEDPLKRKPWCIEKDRFLIIDCWNNFEYFTMNPKGVETGAQTPIPVRLFRAYIEKLKLVRTGDNVESLNNVKSRLRELVNSLPDSNIIVKENQGNIDSAKKDVFWEVLNEKNINYLDNVIAPIMRTLSGVDFKNLKFEKDLVDLSIATLSNNEELYLTIKDQIIEQVSELPLEINVVAREKGLIEEVVKERYWADYDESKINSLINQLGPLMRYRQKPRDPMMKLEVDDLLSIKEFIEFGPEHERISTLKYREKVEEFIRQLEKDNPILQKIKNGETVKDEEITTLAGILEKDELEITEEKLRLAYDNKQAKFIQFIRYILGLEKLESWSTTVSFGFDQFIAEHNNVYTARQIQFLQTLKTYILRTGRIEKKDLVNLPFTQLHPKGIQGLFQPSEIEEILVFAEQFVSVS